MNGPGRKSGKLRGSIVLMVPKMLLSEIQEGFLVKLDLDLGQSFVLFDALEEITPNLHGGLFVHRWILQGDMNA